jgi:hypothetical protein
MESAARVVFVADHTKMNKSKVQRAEEKQYPVFEDPKEWQLWKSRAQWHLITSIDPRIEVANVEPGREMIWDKHGGERRYPKNEEIDAYMSEVNKFAHENVHAHGRFIELNRLKGVAKLPEPFNAR